MSMAARLGTHSAASVLPRGVALLRDPLLNKGTAFGERERNALGLRGLLPAHVLTLEEQAARVIANVRRLPEDLQKYVALNALHDRDNLRPKNGPTPRGRRVHRRQGRILWI